MSVSISKFDYYKLETEFRDGSVVHTTYEWHRSTRKVKEITTWMKGRKIGIGGFGSVWLQTQEGSGELRAVKSLDRNILPTTGFSRELLALIRLKDHEYLFVKFFGWYENERDIFFAMEYLEYGDLGGYITKNEGKARAKAKEITRQILEGLEVLHRKRICHRDLKPQNILIVSPNPVWVKIADFGASKQTKTSSIRTRLGTQGYLAPEMLGLLPRTLGTLEKLTHALDIWSLGCLVHQLLTSHVPFLQSDELDGTPGCYTTLGLEVDVGMLFKYCAGNIDFPTEALQSSQVSEEGIIFVRRLLAVDPKDRPAAAGALQDPWLADSGPESDWYDNLEYEFTKLGAKIVVSDQQRARLIKQAYRADIIEFLPASTKFSALLQQAAAKGLNSALLMLIRSPKGGSIDYSGARRMFEAAAEAKKLDTIQLLLDNKIGTKVDPVGTRIDALVLKWAVGAGHCDTVRLLLGNKLEFDTNTSRRKAFQGAVEAGDVSIVRLLLDHKIHSNDREMGRVALLTVVKRGNIEMASVLLEHGASTGPGAANDLTALRAAVGSGNVDMVKLLLDNKADVNAVSFGRTALQAAAEGGRVDVVKLLLGNKADVNAPAATSSGRTALQAAAGGGHIEIVKLLLNDKADVNAPAAIIYGRTALEAAVKGGHVEIVKLLVDHGVNPNTSTSRYSMNTLEAAAANGNIDIVRLLLDSGANVNASRHGHTALHAAVVGGHIDEVTLLVGNYSRLAYEDGTEEFFTLLDHCRRKLRPVLSSHPRPKHMGLYGNTTLGAAVGSGHVDVVKLLLGRGANVHALSSVYHMTALEIATKYRFDEIKELLVDAGAR